jgi:uroporphyrin-III C-methyltransferase
LPQDLNWAALADPDVTSVIYMGKRTCAELALNLQAHGLPGETAVMLAENVSKPNQKLSRGTVAGLADLVAQDGSDGPALILIGPLAEAP